VAEDAGYDYDHCARNGGERMILHLLGIAVLVYIVLVVLFPHQVIGLTVLAFASLWLALDWTTVPWTP
jgi:hypothetical protein